MSAEDLEVATRFLDALATAAQTGDREVLYPLLGPDVEWLTPKRDLTGLEEVRTDLTWLTAPKQFDLEFERGALADLGGGRVVSDVHEVYRMKGSGEFAYACDRRIELMIENRQVVRYEMRVVG
jgi:hypothetical protein